MPTRNGRLASRRPHRAAAAGAAVLLGMTGFAAAQSDPRFIQFSPGDTKGALYTPDEGERSPIAFLVTHRTSNFMSHVATEELPARGHVTLGMNPRSDNNEAAVDWDLIALDVREGMRFLRGLDGIDKVVLIAHSGGGPTMSFYQALAENGPSYCQGEEKILTCDPERLAGFEPSDRADGIVFLDAHPGNSVNTIRSLNPAVTDEENWQEVEPDLDPFSTENGYDPDGQSSYDPAFVDRYAKAQAERMNRLIDEALAIRDSLEEGDDRPFVIWRTRGRLSDFSDGVHGSTEGPAKLLKNDGSVETGIVDTVRAPNLGRKRADAGFDGADMQTLTSFLSANAIRGDDSLDGIDWCSSNNSTMCAVQSISVPILVVAAQGHYFIRDAEQIHEMSASAEKEFIVVEGMSHGLGPCENCAEFTGAEYGNARSNLFDYIADWTAETVAD